MLKVDGERIETRISVVILATSAVVLAPNHIANKNVWSQEG